MFVWIVFYVKSYTTFFEFFRLRCYQPAIYNFSALLGWSLIIITWYTIVSLYFSVRQTLLFGNVLSGEPYLWLQRHSCENDYNHKELEKLLRFKFNRRSFTLRSLDVFFFRCIFSFEALTCAFSFLLCSVFMRFLFFCYHSYLFVVWQLYNETFRAL